MGSSPSADIQQVAGLLRGLFDLHALDAFVREQADGEAILADIPPHLGIAARIETIVAAWQRRGNIDRALFAALAADAPVHIEKIVAVAAASGVTIDTTPPPPRPRRSLAALLAQIFHSDSSYTTHNRREMLGRVHRFWIDGVLRHSILAHESIDISFATRPDLLPHYWKHVVRRPPEPARLISLGASLFTPTGHAGNLLIIGDPGSGKTTTLLQLANVHLDYAEKDPLAKIPVVFHLASWGSRPVSIRDWLLQELRDAYYIPRGVASEWIDRSSMTLLLDGLDEVPLRLRERCVEAINTFHKDTGIRFVVCCRGAEYQALGTRLVIDAAVAILPLTDEQIVHYLDDDRENLPVDLDLLRTPLMLSIAATVRTSGPPAPDDEPKSALLSAFLDRMFDRCPVATLYSEHQTRRWLSILAAHMAKDNVLVISPETIPPRWLGSWRCVLHIALLATTLGLSILFIMILYREAYWSMRSTTQLTDEGRPEFSDVMVGALTYTGIACIALFASGKFLKAHSLSTTTWSLQTWVARIPLAIAISIATDIPLLISATISLGNESLGVILSFIIYSCILGILFSPIAGFQNHKLADLGASGSWWRHQLRAALISVGVCSALPGVAVAYLLWTGRGWSSSGAIVLSTLLVASVVTYIRGAGIILQHTCLRLVGGTTGILPWRLRRLLDQCVRLALLRPTGTGYCFTHRSFLDFLARAHH